MLFRLRWEKFCILLQQGVLEPEKEGRDILLYLLWKSGIYTNKEIIKFEKEMLALENILKRGRKNIIT